MKLTHKLCGAALVAAVGVVAAFPSGTKAVDGVSLNGGAEVEFTSMSTTVTGPPDNYSGEGSGELDTSEKGTWTDPKGFGISYLTHLNFGTQDSVLTSDGSYWAAPYDNGTVKNSHMVYFEDFRNTANHEYQVTAEMTKQFTTQIGGVDKELDGATITYLNAATRIQNEGAAYVALDASAVNQNIVLSKDGGKVAAVTNRNTANDALYEKGYGKQGLFFGLYGVEGASGSDQSVKLTVPSKKADGTTNVIQGGKYKAEITWAMADTFIP